MNKLAIIFSIFYTFPLYVVYKFLLLINKESALCFKSDLDARKHRGDSFFQLMYNVKVYRNLYYYRLGSCVSLLKIICPPDKSLQLPKSSIHIGRGCFLMHSYRCIVNVDYIGDNFKLFHNCTLGTNTRGGRPRIGDNVTMFANAMILGRVVIGDNSIIGAGCVVTKDVPANCTVIGNPAFIIKKDGEKVNIKL